MIAQLSQSAPFGRPSVSSSGVRSAGSRCRKSGVPFFPHMSSSAKSRPAARTKMRVVRLLTLGLRMLRVLLATSSSFVVLPVRLGRGPVVRERLPGALHHPLDRVGEMDGVDVVVLALDPD